MYEPTVYVIIAETRKVINPSEAYVVSAVTSERGAWEELSEKLNDILNNHPYATVRFIPHETMPYFIGIECVEYLPYLFRIRYTIHKERIKRRGHYNKFY